MRPATCFLYFNIVVLITAAFAQHSFWLGTSPVNGHHYMLVEEYKHAIDWKDAYVAASSYKKDGLTGYLAVFITEEEFDWVSDQIEHNVSVDITSQYVYLGARRDENLPYLWRWVAGPESGEVFFDESNNTCLYFCPWDSMEPSSNATFDVVVMMTRGRQWASINDQGSRAYLVEFGDTPDAAGVKSTRATCVGVRGCSGNGECIGTDICRCYSGWSGAMCDMHTCISVNNCSSNGECRGPNTCCCYPGWTGSSCSKFTCGDRANCSGHGTCIGPNKCQCYTGWTGDKCDTYKTFCIPKTCQNQATYCGNVSDGCGNTLQCGPPCKKVTIATCSGAALTVQDAVPKNGSLIIFTSIPSLGATRQQQWIINGTTIVYANQQNLILGYDTTGRLALFNKLKMTATQFAMFRWTIQRGINTGCGTYITNVGNRLVIDVWQGSRAANTSLAMYPPKSIDRASNELWRIIKLPNSNKVAFQVLNSGSVISVKGVLTGGSMVVASPIVNTTRGPDISQQWIINGHQIQLAAKPNLIIGTTAQQYTGQGFLCQLWNSTKLTATQTKQYQWTVGSAVVRDYGFIYNTPWTKVVTVTPSTGHVSVSHAVPLSTSTASSQLFKITVSF